MHKSALYPRLAAQSIRKNGKLYVPYELTCVGTASMFYILCFLAGNQGMESMPGGRTLSSLMGLGAVVVAFFSVIFLFYTNSFLMKRRRRELGLYNILGMEKRHLALDFVFWETLYTAGIGIGGGLLWGILLSKLLLLLLCALLRFPVPFGFSVSWQGIQLTVLIFLGIFALNLLCNLLRIRRVNPIELLHSSETGEREPKTRWIIAIAGAITLGLGYYMALSVRSAMDALGLFFVAVLLVIVGTYCLFTAGSIAVLKLLRRNKKYYYNPRHFTVVSGMLHRMTRNAAGLASISILSTMVLVTISTTVSLYAGSTGMLKSMYPHNITLTLQYDQEIAEPTAVLQSVARIAKTHGIDSSGIHWYPELLFCVKTDGNVLSLNENGDNNADSDGEAWLYVITADGARALTGQPVSLQAGQAALYCSTGKTEWTTLTVAGNTWTLADALEQNPLAGEDLYFNMNGRQMPVYTLVLPDLNGCSRIAKAISAVYDKSSDYYPFIGKVILDTDAEKDAVVACYQDIKSQVTPAYGSNSDGVSDNGVFHIVHGECRESGEDEYYATYGGFLFVGIFLGLLFLMATVLIIYYKQVSEGYEDRERYVIMQKVGMSAKDVHASIRSQIVTVFFLPLIVAVCHIAGAFHMIIKLLYAFGLTDIGLFTLCTGGTVLVFAGIYCAVYLATARTYYQIVRA